MSATSTATVTAPGFLEVRVTAPAAAHPALARHTRTASPLRLVQVATLVLWAGCAAIGGLGFILSYARPSAPVLPPEPVVVEKLEVVLTPDPVPVTAASADPQDAPPPPAALAQTAPAQPTAVAEPSTVAFALPVEGPVTIVSADQASHARPAANVPAASAATGLPAPQTLVFGQGEGRQPAPEYPASAMNRRQQGVVGVRFTVTPEGRVLHAAVAACSPWPVLDDAAVRTVRHRWRFPRGHVRVYDVAIRFALAE